MNHEEIRQLISQEYDGEATEKEQALIAEHVKDCAACRAYRKNLNKLSTILESWGDETQVPDSMEQAVGRAIQAAAPRRKEEPQMKPKNRLLVYGFGGGVLASVLVAVMVFKVSLPQIKGDDLKSGQLARQFDQGRTVTDHAAPIKKEQIATIAVTTDEKGEDDAIAVPGAAGETQLKIDVVDAAVAPFEMYREKVGVADKGVAMISPGKVNGVERMEGEVFLAGQFMDASEETKVQSASLRTSGGFKSMSFDRTEWDEAPRAQALVEIMPYPQPVPPSYYDADYNTEEYALIEETPFVAALDEPLSTFSIDVDTASYANVRRMLNAGQLPARDVVRTEELINYFDYDYPQPQGEDPFSITIRAAAAPWNPDHGLAMIGLQGKTLDSENLPPSNLVFLIDVSGSMSSRDKLPLLKQGFKMMVNQLGPDERVAIVTYAGSAGTVLESTPGDHKAEILAAIDRLSSGGSTAGGAGIEEAYRIAKAHFIDGGNNRVILATDGDFNVGVSDTAQLTRIIEEKRKEGIFLSILGFGTGNYKDGRMEELSNKGNGNYYYIDTLKEARKVLVTELGSTLFTIAKDVKIQVEFNPGKVKAYRLIGYENRALAKQDFNDDTKDAGELGAGHTVTALYEIIPADSEEAIGDVDALKYQTAQVINSLELMTVKLRYKEPDGDVSKLLTRAVTADKITGQPSGDFAFAAAVAEFSLLLRHSQYKGNASYARVLDGARAAKGADKNGYRQEFIELVDKASMLDAQSGQGIQFK